jgi:hypothetical protein
MAGRITQDEDEIQIARQQPQDHQLPVKEKKAEES